MTAITEAEALALMADTITDACDGLADWTRANRDPEIALRVLALLDRARGALADAKTAAENNLLEALEPGEPLRIDGVGEVIVETKGKQVTDGRKLALAVAAHCADAYGTDANGDPVPPAVISGRTAEEMVAIFGLDNASATFRSTELKRRRMQPGAYRSWDDGQPKVRFEAG